MVSFTRENSDPGCLPEIPVVSEEIRLSSKPTLEPMQAARLRDLGIRFRGVQAGDFTPFSSTRDHRCRRMSNGVTSD